MELAPAGRREGEEGVVGIKGDLLAVGLLEVLTGRGLSRPALSSFSTRTMVSFIPSFTGSGIGFQGGILEMHS